MRKLLPFLLFVSLGLSAQTTDPFLHDLYDRLHDSPMQQKFRKLAPMPFGVVFLPWAGATEADLRHHFRLMKKLGFTNLKQTMSTPEWPTKKTLAIALEEGIIPFWYGEGGWEDITPALLRRLGLPEDLPVATAREHPKMLAYQKTVLAKHLTTWRVPLPGQDTIPYYEHSWDAQLSAEDVPLFREWVRNTYATADELAHAWNQYEVGIEPEPYRSWADFAADPLVRHEPGGDVIIPTVGREYGRVRDILRFKADMYLKNVKNFKRSRYPEQPQRAGGEMGLFLPFAARGTDMEGIADVMTERGSFYPSIHLAWHFEEVGYEVAPCIYMQSSLATDWFKGGWAATWESTGGPQQLSGGKGWNVLSQFETAGYTVNEGTMSQLLLSYLAGGFKGVGLWSWNYRNAGWESGEYALLNRQLEPSPRALRAGAIAKAANRYRDELWAAHKEPQVGVFVNWDNEAIWAAVAGPGRTHFKHYPVKARIGVSRALVNANVPWEHVTPSDLKKGLAPRYRVIYLPAQAAINADLWPLLTDYVRQGGRLVLDAPGGWWDERGRVLQTGPETPFAQLFGAFITDFQYANNAAQSVGNTPLDGFYLTLQPSTATVTDRLSSGLPAATENKVGRGTAVLLAPDASYATRKPRNTGMETWLLRHTLGDLPAPYTCDGALVYRLAAPEADHYFFINDGPATSVKLNFRDYRYASVSDPVTGEFLTLDAPIELEAYGGRWLRFAK